MNPKKVLVTRRFPQAGIELLSQAGFDVTTWSDDRPMTQQELINAAKSHQVLYCTICDKIDQAFLEQCPHLEMISQFGVGYDNINIAEATRLKIPVGFTPDVLTDATADVAFGLMITTARKMFYHHKKILNGNWNYFQPDAGLGIELKNKTLGVFGLGRIGIEMAKRCQGAYNMRVIYHNRSRNFQAEKELNAIFVDFEYLLAQSDVLSVHCALTPQTKGIFNESAFNQMKPTSIFINTARGLVHNEDDLTQALKTGKIWGAGLDVTNPEPMQPDNSLLQMENVSILPHVGSATIEARTKMAALAAQNIIAYFNQQPIPHLVNPEVI